MKKINYFIIFFFLFLLPLSAQAFTVKTMSIVNVPSEETISDNLYSTSQNITIDGKVDGDLICAGSTLSINGEVTGDVICAVENITINGTVNGSVRVIGDKITINGLVARNANLIGSDITLGDNSQIGKDLFIVGEKGNLRGKIGADLHGALGNAVIAGDINKNVFLQLNKITNAKNKPLIIEDKAVVVGSLNYTAGTVGQVSENAQIQGGVNHSFPKDNNKKSWDIINAWARLFSTFAALVIGLVLISLWGRKTKDIINDMQHKPGIKIAIGSGVMFLTPIISLILVFTVIGLPLAFIIFGLWLIALYISKVFVGILVGQSLLKKINSKKKISLLWAMILGVIITWIIYSIPVLGWFFALIASWWGLGGLIYIFKEEEK